MITINLKAMRVIKILTSDPNALLVLEEQEANSQQYFEVKELKNTSTLELLKDLNDFLVLVLPDIIFLECTDPKVNSFELFENIRNIGILEDIPIITCTDFNKINKEKSCFGCC